MHAARPLLLAAATLVVLLDATLAWAKVPYYPYCVVPPVLTVVERDNYGNPDPLGAYRIVVRDINNLPEPGDLVVLDYSGCTDLRLSTDQGPSAELSCPTEQVIGTAGTDAGGVATLYVVGHADHSAPAAPPQSLKVYADGVLIGSVSVAILDQDGNGLGPGDLTLWLGDAFSGTNPARSDYNGDGVVGPADLALWLAAFFACHSTTTGVAATCP